MVWKNRQARQPKTALSQLVGEETLTRAFSAEFYYFIYKA